MVLRTSVNDNLNKYFLFRLLLKYLLKKAKKKELDQRSNEVKENCKSARDTNLTIQEKRIVKVCEMLT